MLKITLKYFAITYHVLIYNAKIYIFLYKTKSIYKKKRNYILVDTKNKKSVPIGTLWGYVQQVHWTEAV